MAMVQFPNNLLPCPCKNATEIWILPPPDTTEGLAYARTWRMLKTICPGRVMAGLDWVIR